MAAVLFLGAFASSRKASIIFIMFVRRCGRPSTYVRVTPTGRMSLELYQAVRIAEGSKNIARKRHNFKVIRTLPLFFKLVPGDGKE
jgi:hypothetical protein